MRFLVVVLLMVATGCTRTSSLVIYNGCNGSWVRVHDGLGQSLVSRLDYGQEVAVDVEGYRGSTVQLLAAGFDLTTNRPLGSAVTTRHFPYNGGTVVTGPSQVQSWQIMHLSTTDPKGGCRR